MGLYTPPFLKDIEILMHNSIPALKGRVFSRGKCESSVILKR